MKKAIFIIAFLLCAGMMFGQRAVTAASGSTTSLQSTEHQVNITTTASDTVGGTATKYWLINVNKPKLQLWSVVTNIDTIKNHSRSAGNRVRFRLYGSLDGSTFVQVGSTVWYNKNAGTNPDSTFAVSDVSTGILWKYFKIEYTGVVANKAAKPTLIQIKFADK